jgi:hypothetical protein
VIVAVALLVGIASHSSQVVVLRSETKRSGNEEREIVALTSLTCI